MQAKYRYSMLIALVILAILVGIFIIISLFRNDLTQSKKYTDIDFSISNDTKLVVYEKMVVQLRKRQNPPKLGNFYQKRVETAHIDCGRVLQRDREYIQSITAANHRIPLIEDVDLDMDCEAVRFRIHPAEHLKPLQHGIAFARIVYRDYEFIEKQVQVSFHPNNTFCFAVDKKAPDEFRSKMKRMGECIDNVIVLPATETYTSGGHNYTSANLRCMKHLVNLPNWNYLLLLQNHDVVTKSVYELEKIYRILGGANDVAVGKEIEGRRKQGLKWDPRTLKLFRNESKIPEEVLKTPMTIASGYSQASISREAVEWMVHSVDLTGYIKQWDHTEYAADEQFFSSFQANAQLEMPGHFTDECLKRGVAIDQISRMTQWRSTSQAECETGAFRHSICIMGIENLWQLSRMPVVMFNKMLPSFDYSIVECTAELLYNRTFLGQVDQELDENYYANMVLYHKNHLEPDYRLNCTPSYVPWGDTWRVKHTF